MKKLILSSKKYVPIKDKASVIFLSFEPDLFIISYTPEIMLKFVATLEE